MAESIEVPGFASLNCEDADTEHLLNELEIALLQRPEEFGEAIALIRVVGIEAVGKMVDVVSQSPEHLHAVQQAYEVFSSGADKGVVAFDTTTEAQIDANPKLQALIHNQQMDPELRSARVRQHRFEIFAKRVLDWRASMNKDDATLKQTA